MKPTIEAAVVLLIEAASPQIAGGRIYHVFLPDSPTFPAMTFQRISTFRERNVDDGPAGVARTRVQIDFWGADYDSTKTVAEQVRAILDGYRGTVSDDGSPANAWDVLSISLDNDGDLFEDGRRLFRGTADYIVVYREG